VGQCEIVRGLLGTSLCDPSVERLNPWFVRPLGALVCTGLLGLLLGLPTQALAKKSRKSQAAPASAAAAAKGYDAEARLIQIYQTIGRAKTREALLMADQLAKDYPNFALAQLVLGDLLSTQTRPIKSMGDIPEAATRAAPGVLVELREESLLRLKALRERPPVGMVPSQFVRLSAQNKHAIAVDASRSRLYVFENTSTGMRLVADHYISVGKLGVEKSLEGDLRTPVGVYFITNTYKRKNLKDFYGAGALPINYPNPYDLRLGKTGSGIWLHGTPSNQFSRPPKASDGCVVLSNPDLERILATVEVRSTPVVIAPSLQWVSPAQSNPNNKAFDEVWNQWRNAKASADLPRTMAYYTSDFNSYGKTLSDWSSLLQADMVKAKGREFQIKDLSVLQWADNAKTATMVVTFSEIPAGSSTGSTKRQYWLRSPSGTQNQWKIFFEGIVS
jgi:L,D-transpeptidase YnhG